MLDRIGRIMANILVTGGAGFIGSHLAHRFVEMGHRVRVVDNLSTGHVANLAKIRDRIELIEDDLRDPDVCRQACDGVDYVFHEAALGSVPKSVDDPQASHEHNINATFNLLLAAKDCKVRRFIYAGSSSAYGDTEESPKHEGIVPTPLSPYAVQKLTGEHYCRSFTECFGMETITLRYFNVFGSRQDPASQYAAAIPAFVAAILEGEPPVIFGDGEQTRDFTHIDNITHGNVLAMKAERTHGEAINVACGGKITVNAVIAAINKALGTDVSPRYVPPRKGDILHSCADIGLAKRILGFEPIVDFDEGLRRTIDYYTALAAPSSS